MTTSAQPLATSTTGRIDRLTDQVRHVRTRASAGSLDRWLLVLGLLLMPVGIVFIILGWAGASRTPLPFEQIDYLISGGLIGLALVISGGFLYFAYWQTVRVHESRTQAAALTASVRRLEALLGASVADGTITVPEPEFVATEAGTVYHRVDCAAVAGRDDVSTIDVATTTLEPCRICTPDA